MRNLTLAFSIIAILSMGLFGTEAAAESASVVTIRCSPDDTTTCFLVNWAPATAAGVYKGRYVDHTVTRDALAIPDPEDQIAIGVFMSFDGGEQGLGWLNQQVIIKPGALMVLVNLADGATEYISMSEWLAAGGMILE